MEKIPAQGFPAFEACGRAVTLVLSVTAGHLMSRGNEEEWCLSYLRVPDTLTKATSGRT